MRRFCIFSLVLSLTMLSGVAQFRESVGSLDFADWSGVKGSRDGVVTLSMDEGRTAINYIYPQGENSAKGFKEFYHGSDWSRYSGVALDIFLKSEGVTELELTFGVALENMRTLEPTASAKVSVAAAGWNRVYVPWSRFSLRGGQKGTLQGVKSFEIVVNSQSNKMVKIRNVELLAAETISLSTPILGKSTLSGGDVEYEVEVGNVTSQLQMVELSTPLMGWEAMSVEITPSSFALQPLEKKSIKVKVSLSDNLPQGTNEVQKIQATANGRPAESIEFTTSVKVSSPYLVHTAQEWDYVIEKAEKYEWAKVDYNNYITQGDRWQVPALPKELPSMNPQLGRYLFHSNEGDTLMDCAIAYRLTGDKKYAQKCVDFLRVLIDEERGYPSTWRVNQNNFVKEGGVFQNIARTYDMIMDSGLLTEHDHELIEKTFRLYIGIALDGNDNGGIGNWDLSELTGALYCALMVGDFHLAKEVLYSPSGIYQQFAQGVMSDGWWYECSVGYNVWCATMFSEAGIALRPWGVNFIDEEIVLGKVPHYSLLPERMKAGLYGMDFNKWGAISNNSLGIKGMWDALVPFLDYRGIMFAVNDAQETKVVGEPFELAYYLYRDPEYAAVINYSGERNLLYGVPDLPQVESVKATHSAYADNLGAVQLRSQTSGREQREQIQAALHYGSHGGYHGHFDRTNLLSMMRYGRSFYNPEMIWYGYGAYAYKFLVQSSMTKNMVVVDQKMQEPVESSRTLFYTGDMIQATAVETTARWSNPPYGGMIYGDKSDYTFAQKMWEEGRVIPIPKNAPGYGELSDFTEPILQRRLMLMLDDYIVLVDYVEGDEEHTYDWLFHMKGLNDFGADSGMEFIRHNAQLSEEPLSAAQFFTDCSWYKYDGTLHSSYEMIFGEGEDLAGTRSLFNEDGSLKVNVFNAWPQSGEATIATVPESHGVNKQVWFEIKGDNDVIMSDSTGAWILGNRAINLDVKGRKELTLSTKLAAKPANNTLFWGDAAVVLSSGEEVNLLALPLKYSNVLQPLEQGMDYYGGEVKIGGLLSKTALAAMPQNYSSEAVITVDISSLDAVAFKANFGGDYPLGDESQRRKSLNVRSEGKNAQFISVIEPYEGDSMVKSVKAESSSLLTVELTDGRVQLIEISNFVDSPEEISIHVKEYVDGELVREESAKN
ncbi:MAG: hypothetical protein SNJ33_01125 [Rikenellaceae bacterium]